jgi:hypothetical protein
MGEEQVKPIKRMLACAAALATIATLGATTTPAAAAADPTAPVSVTRLILEPTDRGYVGSIRITVRNTSTQPIVPSVGFVEPVAGSWLRITPIGGCDTYLDGFDPPASPRRITCRLDRILAPGEQIRLTAEFQALTRTRVYAMSASDATVYVGDGFAEGEYSGSATFTTRFRSTGGSLANPRPYVQDTQTNATLTTADEVVLARMPGPDYNFVGRLTVTVRWRGDTPHQHVSVSASQPEGVGILRTDPPSGSCGFTSCEVPGGPFMPGEVRTFDLFLSGSTELEPGPLGIMPLTLTTVWENVVPDLNPADDVVQVAVTAVQ